MGTSRAYDGVQWRTIALSLGNALPHDAPSNHTLNLRSGPERVGATVTSQCRRHSTRHPHPVKNNCYAEDRPRVDGMRAQHKGECQVVLHAHHTQKQTKGGCPLSRASICLEFRCFEKNATGKLIKAVDTF